MLGALTDFVSSPRGKWVTLAAWVLVAGALLSQLPRLDEVRENEEALFLPGDAESTLAYELARDEFPAGGTPTLIVFREPDGLSGPTLDAVDDLVAWLTGPEAPDNVGEVRAPGTVPGLVSPDDTTLYIFAELLGEPAEEPFADTVNAIRDRTSALDLPGVEVAVGGPGGLVVDIVGVFRQIDTFLLLVTVALVLALLIAIYRSPIMASIPLLGVGLVFQLAGGIAAFVAQQFELPVSGQATGIMTVVLFGTGTDYVLFVSARFREELTRHADRHEAMRRTMRGVGGAVASAGATILVASAALWFAILRSYQSLGPVIALAVALMMLAALTLIPAVLTILGRRAFWPLQPRLAEGPETPVDWRESVYGRIGGVVLRRPRGTLAVTCGGLALLVAGLFAYEPTYDRLESLPDNTESVRSFELLRTGFPGGELARTRVFVSLAPGEQALEEGALAKLDAVTTALPGHPLVAGAAGPSRPFGIEAGYAGGPAAEAARASFVSADGDEARIDVVLGTNPYAEEALSAVPELRELARETAAGAGLGADSVLIGGETAEAYDTRVAGNRDSRVVLPLILLAIGVVLALLLRSLVAPLYLMATIAFTYFATLGLAVVVFVVVLGQSGVGQGVPFFLFVFLNALSVDYNIYLMSRIR
ncbi:MAG: MMPL family transporter, partial [Chloroflexi bacterium]|nr:MMPL family transporter [Chloroflexota bacterium]